MAHCRTAVRISALFRHMTAVKNSTPSCSHVLPRLLSSGTPGDAVLSTRKSVDVLDSTMSYLDTGVGDNVVIFLHGNPTAAYLWRNIIPHVQPTARCLAPDLIGMGHSAKLPSHNYRFADHYRYLSAWIEKMNLPSKVSLVIHDWGSGLGFHWSNEHRDRVQALVHMESVVRPVLSWDRFPEVARNIFQALRSDAGEEIVLQKNFFVEKLLPLAIMRKLTDEEMAEYRRPYMEPGEDRRPTLTWPREIPIVSDGPEDVVKLVEAYHSWLSESDDLPKLYINGEPGFFSPGIKKTCAKWPNQKTVNVPGLHFLQEDSPTEIGQAIRTFLEEVYASN